MGSAPASGAANGALAVGSLGRGQGIGPFAVTARCSARGRAELRAGRPRSPIRISPRERVGVHCRWIKAFREILNRTLTLTLTPEVHWKIRITIRIMMKRIAA